MFFKVPLINAHAHAAMTAFRGLAEDLPLNKWLECFIWPAEKKKVNPQFVYRETKKAITEMKKNGIGAFLDMYFFEEEVARAAIELKMPVVIGEGILDFPTPSAKTPEEALQKTEKLLQKYKNHPLVSVSVAPHSIYAVCGKNIQKAKALARKYQAIMQIHTAETKKEFDECLKKNKKTPVAFLDSLGVLDEKTILIHCVWITDNDIDLIKKRKAKVVHCPLSNLKLGSGIMPLNKFLAKGIAVALGTDGSASSNRLDIWEAGKMAALVQKGINLDPTLVPVEKTLEMMTINGMEALNLKKIAGKSLAEWKKELKKAKNLADLYYLNSSEVKFR